MKPLLVLAGCLIAVAGPLLVRADTLFTTPVLYVSPAKLDFGRVATNTVATNTLLVENMGRGRLVGKAKVRPPFKIRSGADYELGENEVQVITVTYKPSGAAIDKQVMEFTGGGGGKATLIGKPGGEAPEKAKGK